MQAWQDLINGALIGTERQAAASAPAPGALGETLTALDGADREGRVLSAAGAMAVWRQAGSVPASAPAPPEPVCLEDIPRCSPRAARYLGQILNNTHPALLPEWLEHVAAQGRRVPEPLLPALLNAGYANRDLRPGVEAVLGRRGRWLAAQNKQWSYVAGEVDEEDPTAWETGSRETRLAFLRKVRASDPDRARALVREVWSQEAARDRNAFLETFSLRLTLADEPFLEACLADKSKEVRATAAGLLTTLPQSQLTARMIERVDPLLSFRPNSKGGWQVEVELPGAFSPELARDGVEEKPPQGIGERAWWLLQMLGAVPPSWWSQNWGRTPAELVEVAAGSGEWRDVLLEGWSRAAQRYQDADWAEPLVQRWVKLNKRNTWSSPGWAQALSPAGLERVVRNLLEDEKVPLKYNSPVVELLQHCARPWSPALSRIALDRFRANIDGLNAVSQVAYALAPGVLEEAERDWPDFKDWRNGTIQQLIGGVQFRREMLDALQARGDDGRE